MRSPGINGEGELRGQPSSPGSPGKMAIKTECVCVCYDWVKLCIITWEVEGIRQRGQKKRPGGIVLKMTWKV